MDHSLEQHRELLRAELAALPPVSPRMAACRDLFRRIRRVAIIAGASRSGSSHLFALLRRLPGVISPPGECQPYYRLHGLPLNPGPEGDALGPETSKLDLDAMAGEMLAMLGSAATSKDRYDTPGLLEAHTARLTRTLLLQWPGFRGHGAELYERISTGLHRGWDPRFGPVSGGPGWNDLTEFLHRLEPRFHPSWYDGAVRTSGEPSPGIDPLGPPHDGPILEDPPFLRLAPEGPLEPRELETSWLLLKTTADCHRPHLLRALFPEAELRWLHLVRNPASSLNGLYDGWLHQGFHSWDLGNSPTLPASGLDLEPYSSRHPSGRRWWKFDLPPGWPALTALPLAEVCTAQWESANRALSEYLSASNETCMRVRHEHLVTDASSFRHCLAGILSFLGLPKEAGRAFEFAAHPLVQATRAPTPYRWRERAALFEPLLETPAVVDLTATLGYDPGRREEWV